MTARSRRWEFHKCTLGSVGWHALIVSLGDGIINDHCQLIQEVAELSWSNLIQYALDLSRVSQQG